MNESRTDLAQVIRLALDMIKLPNSELNHIIF